MKNITALFISFLLFTNVNAQDQDAIKAEANKYYDILKNMDLVKTLNMTYPRIFEIVPRDKMEESFAKIFDDSTIRMQFSNFSIGNISNSIQKDGIKYALVKYAYTLSLTFNEEMDKDFEKPMLNTYKEMYGKKNVIYNRDTQTFVITVNTSMFAIKDPQFGGWKFLENKPTMITLLGKLIPEDVMQQLN